MSEEKEWKKIEADIVKLENEGDSIEGVIKSVEDSKKFDNKVYKIETSEGLKTLFGTSLIDSQLAGIDVGKEVKIVNAGTKESEKGNPLKLFEIFVK